MQTLCKCRGTSFNSPVNPSNETMQNKEHDVLSHTYLPIYKFSSNLLHGKIWKIPQDIYNL